MINLTENIPYRFTIIKQIYNGNVDIFELSGLTFNSIDKLGIVYAEPDMDNKIIESTEEIITGNPYYFIEYWKDDEHMAVMENVTFVEIDEAFAIINSRLSSDMETILKIEKA